MAESFILVSIKLVSDEAIDFANSLLIEGFKLRLSDGNLFIAPRANLSEAQLVGVKRHRDELVRLLKLTCPKCRRWLDQRRNGACWKCWTRPCEVCGKDSGSCFIATCATCGALMED